MELNEKQKQIVETRDGQIKVCFMPEKDNPYPLCIGQDLEKCKDCQLRADWEPEYPYGVER